MAISTNKFYGTTVADGDGVDVNPEVAVGTPVLVGVGVIVAVAVGRAVGVMISVPR